MSILAGEKFELKFLPLNLIKLHEECEDNRSSRLTERFNTEKVLYNPLIIGVIDNEYILIDGANRFEALKETGCKSILAQLVDYRSSEVTLKSWYHFVNNISLTDLKNYAAANGIRITDREPAKKPVALNQLAVFSSDNKTVCLELDPDPEKMLKILSGLNRYYENEFSYIRIDSDTDITDVKLLSPDSGLLFVFPEFSKEDIVKIARSNQKLPAGISRHLIPNRVLHIKILIDALRTDENLVKRNEELEKYIRYKIDSNKVRLYREPILVFDE